MVDEIWGSEHRTYGCIAYSHSHFRPNSLRNYRHLFEAIEDFYRRHLYPLLNDTIYGHFDPLLDRDELNDLMREECTPDDHASHEANGPDKDDKPRFRRKPRPMILMIVLVHQREGSLQWQTVPWAKETRDKPPYHQMA